MSSHKDNLLAARFVALAPEPLAGDWDNVLDRAGAGHRRHTRRFPPWRVVAVVAVILVGALLVTELGIGGRLLDLIESAPPAQPETQTPVWSPGGQKFVFSSWRNGDWEIYVWQAGRIGQRNLTGNSARDGLPAWSPDGRKLSSCATSKAATASTS